ncbi:MAG: hypothetical protein ABIQ40_12315 [Bacteroidia bacterium]
MDKTFAEFKRDFYSRVKDFSLFDSGEFNLLKVVLDGLKVDYASKGKIRIFIFSSPLLINLYFFVNRMRTAFSAAKLPVRKDWIECLQQVSKRKFLTIDPGGRTIKKQERNVSFYYGNILNSLGRENVISIVEGRKPNLPEHDLHISEYNSMLASLCGNLNREDKAQLRQLSKTYIKIEASGIFSDAEKLNIQIAFQQFFIQHLFWRNMLKYINPEKVLLWPHYHREGCIAALREKKIHVIELQHGLIAAEDIFYVLPEQVRSVEKKALFADEIWVYGQFWKDQLLKGAGYEDKQIRIVGFYPVSIVPSEKLVADYKNTFPGKKNILVTTQTFMDEYFCKYIQFLSADLLSRSLPYGIIVKLHPAESVEKYATLKSMENVKIVNENLDVLFRAAEIHISSFSTTLFDALRFNVPNFSIWVELYDDYISLFRDEGISRVINGSENPLDFPVADKQRKADEYYYEKFDPSTLKQLLS